MKKNVVSMFLATSAISALVSFAASAAVERKILLQQDLPTPNQSAALVELTIPPGEREGRHIHPGAVVVYILQGALTVSTDGAPLKTYQTGETFYIPPGTVHEGINNGQSTMKALASFVSEKGKPLTSAAP